MSEAVSIEKLKESYEDIDNYLFLNEGTDWVKSRLWVHVIIDKIKSYFSNEEKISKNKKINNLNINGKWGSGKTTVAYNVIKHVNMEVKAKMFSLWEYEIDSEPYLKILIELMIFCDIEINQEVMRKIKYSLSASFSLFGFLNFGISGHEEPNINNKTLFNKLMKDNDINNLIELINSKTKENKYLIVLDELDRCAPNKISEFLSIIKNLFFKLKNVYFIVCTNNEVINFSLQNQYFNNSENEKYTDKIFEQSIDLNTFLTFDNLPVLLKNNSLITKFINRMNLMDLRLINKIYLSISKWKSEDVKNYISVFDSFSKRYNNYDIKENVQYFYLFFFYFLKFSKINNFKNLVDKIITYDILKNNYVSVNNLENIKINFDSQEILRNRHNKSFDPSNFFVSLENNQQISGILFDFLTQERKNEFIFNAVGDSNFPYFLSNFSLDNFKKVVNEQSLNLENKVFLEIFMGIQNESAPTLWNIDFNNLKKIIFDYVLLDN